MPVPTSRRFALAALLGALLVPLAPSGRVAADWRPEEVTQTSRFT
jgi:hypothetical protein